MLFPYAFWPPAADMFGRMAETTAQRGEFFLFYSYAHVGGGPVLAALVAGDAAEAFEQEPAETAVARVMAVLRSIYEPQGINVPAPLEVHYAFSLFCSKYSLRLFAVFALKEFKSSSISADG